MLTMSKLVRSTMPRILAASLCVGLALLILLIPTARPALAHITQGSMGGFASGFRHPMGGADHFLAMFAVGIWGAQMGGRSVWTLPVTFPLVMALGGLAGMAGVTLPDVELGIALSILALGSAILFAWRPKECQSALNFDPLSACNIDPLFGRVEVVPVVHRGDPRGFV